MEAIKNAIGLGPSSQAGQEPVSGQTGEGTATAPYDAGNQQEDPNLAGKAPQETVPQTFSETPSSNPTHDDFAIPNSSTHKPLEPSADTTTDSTIQATSTSEYQPSTSSLPTTGGASKAPEPKSEPAPAPEPAPTVAAAPSPQPEPQSEPQPEPTQPKSEPEPEGKPSIGSPGWFKTALPIGQRKSAEPAKKSTPKAAAPTESAAETKQPSEPSGTAAPAPVLASAPAPEPAPQDPKDLPPNHLTTDVPKGHSKDLDTNNYPPKAAENTPPTTAMSSEQPTTSGAMSATQPMPDDSTVGSNPAPPMGTESGVASSSLQGSRASVAAVPKPDYTDSPLKPADASHPVHHGHGGSIPSAGGVPVGQEAGEARRASIAERKSMQATAPEDLPQTSENASMPPPEPTETGNSGGTDTQFNNPFGEGKTSAGQDSPAASSKDVSSGKADQGTEGTPEKKSTKEKLKEKLHIGHHK